MEVRAKTMTISPSVAKQWLEKTAPNRRVSPQAVTRYASDMREGRWAANGSTIVMGASGKILDGQHRLSAIIEAGIPVEMIVVSGVEDEAFMTIDTGRPRSPADVLRVMGYPNHINLAASARQLILYEDTGGFGWGEGTLSQQELIATAASRAEELEEGIRACQSVWSKLGGATGVWVVLWLKLGEIDPLDRNLFFGALVDGEGLNAGNPMLALRNYLLERRGRRGGRRGMAPQMLAALVIKAWNKYRNHESVERLGWRGDEPFPEPI